MQLLYFPVVLLHLLLCILNPFPTSIAAVQPYNLSSLQLPFTFPLHRSTSMHSPFRKVYSSDVESLVDMMEMDTMRLREFSYRLETSLAHFHGSRVFANEKSASKAKSTTMWNTVTAGASAGTGQYLVSFYIGTPAQHFLLIADTGSDLVWVNCCEKCNGKQQQSFETRKSTTFSPVACFRPQCSLVPSPVNTTCRKGPPAGVCKYDYTYADLSHSTGIFAYETATLNASAKKAAKVKHVAFGCGFKSTGRSLKGSSGVLGLGRGDISFASQLGAMVDYTFSYCFADFFRLPARGSYLRFGKTRNRMMQVTPLLENPFVRSFYYVGVEKVSIDGVAVPVEPKLWRFDDEGNGGTVMDSGTTLTYFLEPAYREILKAFRRRMPYPLIRLDMPTASFDLCFNASMAAKNGPISLPQLEIAMAGNAIFRPPPQNYFVELSPELKCLGIQGISPRHGFSVLGNLLQQNFVMEFDAKRNLLGFVPTLCSHT